jgi:hypothetical protein
MNGMTRVRIYELPANNRESQRSRDYPTPLQFQLQQMGLGQQDVSPIIHEYSDNVCIGVRHDQVNHFFDNPVDVTVATNNIVHDDVHRFFIHNLESQQVSILNNLVGTRTQIYLRDDDLELLLVNSQNSISVQLAWDEREGRLHNDYFNLNSAATTIDQEILSSDFRQLGDDGIVSITSLYHRYVKTLPYTDGTTGFDLVNAQSTVEDTLQLQCDNATYFFTPETFRVSMRGSFIYISEPVQVFDHIADNKLRVARRLRLQ